MQPHQYAWPVVQAFVQCLMKILRFRRQPLQPESLRIAHESRAGLFRQMQAPLQVFVSQVGALRLGELFCGEFAQRFKQAKATRFGRIVLTLFHKE